AIGQRVPRVPDRVPLRGSGRAGGRMTRIVFSSLVLVVLVARSAHAVVTGTIVGPGSESFPIAVVPPKSLGGDPGGALGARFAKALTRDLDFSGYFKLLDPKTFVENPETSGITAGEIDFVEIGRASCREAV